MKKQSFATRKEISESKRIFFDFVLLKSSIYFCRSTGGITNLPLSLIFIMADRLTKHSNTGQVSRSSEADEIGPSNAAAVSFFDPPIYGKDPETGRRILRREGSWWTTVCDPAPSVIQRWNQTEEEDLPQIPSELGSGPAVMEEFHAHGKRMKICGSCGLKSHPSEAGTVSMYPHLSHIIMAGRDIFREPGWYCSEWCRSTANDFVKGTFVCANALATGKNREALSPYSSPVKSTKVSSTKVSSIKATRHPLPIGAAGPSTTGRRRDRKGSSQPAITTVLHLDKAATHTGSWADA